MSSMTHISSRDNPTYKYVARLQRGKDPHYAVLEGVHLCQAWLQFNGGPELALFDGARLETSTELRGLAQSLGDGRAMTCESRLMRALSDVEHGQGVCFLAEIPKPRLQEHVAQTCIWLDRIQDPGNLGTILRTAAAAGIVDAYLSAGCAQAWSQKVLRSAQGAHFVMNIHQHLDLHDLSARLTIPLVATVAGDAQSVYDTALPEHCAWLFGNEGQGVAADLQALSDIRVFIPQTSAVESLNVGAATAICLFEHRRRFLACA